MDLQTFFSELNVRKIRKMVDEQQTEDLWLEFKTVSSAEMKREDRANFAKALSGFANSSGGVVIWGVDARGNDQGVDCACALKEIESVSRFYSKLNEYTGQFVTPIVKGVQHLKFKTKGDKGLAATLIPESDVGPHMAKGGLDRYYKRSGSSFYQMEHFDIADMFGKRKQPKLIPMRELVLDRLVKNRERVTAILKAVISIRNEGRGSAKFPFITLWVHHPYKIDRFELDGGGRSGLPRRNPRTRGAAQYTAGVDTVIHPGMTIPLTKVGDIEVSIPATSEPSAMNIEYEIEAEDMETVKGQLVISGEEIVDFALSKAR